MAEGRVSDGWHEAIDDAVDAIFAEREWLVGSDPLDREFRKMEAMVARRDGGDAVTRTT